MHYIKLELFKTNKRGCHKILQHKRCHHLTLCSVIDPWVKDWFVRGWNFIPYLPPNHHPPIKKFAGFFSTNFYFYIWYFIWCLCENSWCHAISNFLGVDISDKKCDKCLNWSQQIQDTILNSKVGVRVCYQSENEINTCILVTAVCSSVNLIIDRL